MLKRRIAGIPMPVLIIIVLFLIILFVAGLAIGPIGQSFGIHPPAFLSITQPQIILPAEVIFHVLGLPITNTMIAAWITMVFLIILCFAATHPTRLIPGRLQSALEFLFGWLYSFCSNAAGEKNGRRFFPLVATIFLFVGFNAWLGLIPGYNSITVNTAEGVVPLIRPANTDVNTPLAIALVAVFSVQFFGLKSLGFHYIGKFLNFGGFFRGVKLLFTGHVGEGFTTIVSGVVEIFVGFLEALSELIHVISFTFRLFGNMTAGEILVLMVLFLAPWVVGIAFYGLELLIGFIQGLIFAGLTLVFLTLAVSSHEEEERQQT